MHGFESVCGGCGVQFVYLKLVNNPTIGYIVSTKCGLKLCGGCRVQYTCACAVGPHSRNLSLWCVEGGRWLWWRVGG